MSNLRGVGREAEDRAADFLVTEGYTIVTRRHKTRRGELDIVALDGDTLVFVEVKFRRPADYQPEASISESKLSTLQVAIKLYLGEMDIQADQVRLDLIAIDANGLRHYKDILAL